jgi:hypothetical protein
MVPRKPAVPADVSARVLDLVAQLDIDAGPPPARGVTRSARRG